MESPYDKIFAGILVFKDFAAAESTLFQLEELRQSFLQKGDKKGERYCLRIGHLGRRRARLIADNLRVARQKRAQKAEIAFWFQVWLETAELFQDWLVLRKSTKDFKRIEDAT